MSLLRRMIHTDEDVAKQAKQRRLYEEVRRTRRPAHSPPTYESYAPPPTQKEILSERYRGLMLVGDDQLRMQSSNERRVLHNDPVYQKLLEASFFKYKLSIGHSISTTDIIYYEGWCVDLMYQMEHRQMTMDRYNSILNGQMQLTPKVNEKPLLDGQTQLTPKVDENEKPLLEKLIALYIR